MSAEDRLVVRFRQSMQIDYEKWHDGIGYDLDAVRSATGRARDEIEALLLPRADRDWRDVEALAALDSPAARAALRGAVRTGSEEVRMAVLRHAPQLFDDTARTRRLAAAFDEIAIGNGLTALVDQVSDFHPPPVVEALLRAVLARDGATAVHLAGLALFVHGQAESNFDWAQRPFLLRFNTPDPGARREAFVELCARIGIAPDPYLGR